MFFDWFNTKEAAEIGVKLANDLSVELGKIKNSNLKKEIKSGAKVLQMVFVQAGDIKTNGRLNFYKKSKLANEFKWRLLALGYSEEFVDDLTKELLLYMN